MKSFSGRLLSVVEVQGKAPASSGIFGNTWPKNEESLSLPLNLELQAPPKGPQEYTSTPPTICPDCGSKGPFDRDGLRYLKDGTLKQRWLCRECSFRFSEAKTLKSDVNILNTRQICDSETKNLVATETKTVAGDLEKLPKDARGLIIKYMAYLEREAFSADICYPNYLKRLVKNGANLLDPENVKTAIARLKHPDGTPCKNGSKMLSVYAYDAFCKMQGIKWDMPTYRQEEAEIFVPDEKELDQLIYGTHSKWMATFLQTLKETFADPGEILKAEWIDLKDNVLSINHPVKGHLSGKCELTPRLVGMLNNLPKTDKKMFPRTYRSAKASFVSLRKRISYLMQNPRILTISFKSYRHWGGSMLAHYTDGNVLTIKRMLRHKSITSTMKYIHTIEFKEEDFETAIATTPEEIQRLGQEGWVKYDEINFNGTQMHFYRKPKRFGGLKKYA